MMMHISGFETSYMVHTAAEQVRYDSDATHHLGAIIGRSGHARTSCGRDIYGVAGTVSPGLMESTRSVHCGSCSEIVTPPPSRDQLAAAAIAAIDPHSTRLHLAAQLATMSHIGPDHEGYYSEMLMVISRLATGSEQHARWEHLDRNPEMSCVDADGACMYCGQPEVEHNGMSARALHGLLGAHARPLAKAPELEPVTISIPSVTLSVADSDGMEIVSTSPDHDIAGADLRRHLDRQACESYADAVLLWWSGSGSESFVIQNGSASYDCWTRAAHLVS